MYRKIYYEELAHRIMEVRSPRSCCLQAEDLGKLVIPVIPVQVQRPETRGASGINPSSRAGEDQYPSSTGRQEAKKQANSSLLCLFVLFRPSKDLIMPTHIWEGSLLY